MVLLVSSSRSIGSRGGPMAFAVVNDQVIELDIIADPESIDSQSRIGCPESAPSTTETLDIVANPPRACRYAVRTFEGSRGARTLLWQ